MGEDIDPLTTEPQPKPIVRSQLLAAMAVLVAIMTIAGFAIDGTRFAIGVVVGGVLAFVNYLWLDSSTRALFAPDGSSPAWVLAIKYLLRYIAIGLAIWLIYFTGAVPVIAVILGLSVFAFAVVFQGLKNIFTSAF